MSQTIEILCQFFDRTVPSLAETYTWPIPNISGFDYANQSGYQANLELKQYLKTLWENASSDDEKIKVADIIIRLWGRVRGNKAETLMEYVRAISKNIPVTPLKGVASYSKLFSIVYPDRHAIYDARVAACLNSVQINAGTENGLAFNYIPGRNNIVGNSVKKIGFTHDPRFSTERLINKLHWRSIEPDQTYTKYLELLSDCLKSRPNYKLTWLEMALFAHAESECQKAISINYGQFSSVD